MFIKERCNLSRDDLKTCIYLPRINLLDMKLGDMLDKAADFDQDIQKGLNEINNQGIHDLNIKARIYKRKDVTLGFRDMSSGERLFMAAYAADISKTSIIVQGEVGQLTNRNLVRFMSKFGKSDFVNVACIEGIDVEYYKGLLEGRLM